MMEYLGIDDYDAKNLKSKCPFHNEDTPSFIYNKKQYNAHCFGACGRSYDLIDVLMYKGMTYIEALQELFKLAKMQYSFGEHKVRTKHQYRYPKEVICTDKNKVYEYLALRKISKQTVDYADVREDDKGNMVFNFYDTNDVLTMVKYRPARKIDKAKGDIKTWCQKDADTSHLLFNLNKINTEKPLLICEGEIDCLSAIEAGFFNATSVPLGAGNYQWIEENWDFLEQFSSIIICSDNDEAGIKLQKEAVYRLGSWRTKVIDIPPYYQKPDRKKIRIKDLNEVLYYFGKEKVMDLILNAKDTPVDSVSDFSDIKDVDLDEIDGITTGIEQLDKSLMKLFYGTFNIVTGVNGSGKSSFLSQLICECLDQNKNAFMYSGELPNFQTKNWINFILAGQRNLIEYTYGNATHYKVSKIAKSQIDKFYKGKLYIYKDGYDHRVSTILKSVEDSIRKYGTKLIIIDNLTSVNLEGNDDNKYSKQEEFVSNLIDIAKKYNVVVVLVVHPHKIDTMRRLTKMDVQGISAIIDLAHRIISLYRVTKADKKGERIVNGKKYSMPPIKYDVLCDILKDRMLGYEGSTVGLYYDKPSRRFFYDEKSLDRQYKWDKKMYTTPIPYPAKQLDEEKEVFGEIGGDK